MIVFYATKEVILEIEAGVAGYMNHVETNITSGGRDRIISKPPLYCRKYSTALMLIGNQPHRGVAAAVKVPLLLTSKLQFNHFGIKTAVNHKREE